MNKLLLSDMDGTLLNHKGEVSIPNANAIASFITQGNYFGVATGRTQNNVLTQLQGVAVNAPCVLYNGAAVYDFAQQKFLFRTYLPQGFAKQIHDFVMERFSNIAATVFFEDAAVSYHEDVLEQGVHDPAFVKTMKMRKKPLISGTMEELSRDRVMKMVLIGTHVRINEAKNAMVEAGFAQIADIVRTTQFTMELLPKGYNKGTGMRLIAEYLGVDRIDCYGIGDCYNDVELVRMAAIGAAPDNAVPLAKEKADMIVADNDNHAVAEMIDSLMKE